MEAEAKVSLDSSGFSAGAEKVNRSSREMANNSEAAADRMRRAMDKTDDISLKSSRKVAGNLKAIELALLSGADASTLLQVGMMKVAESFKLGFGGTVALAGATMGVQKLTAAYQEAQAAETGFKKVLMDNSVSRPGATAGDYDAQIHAITEARANAREKTGGFASTMAEVYKGIFTQGFNPFGGGQTSEQDERDRDDAAASARVVQAQNMKVGALREENVLRERAAALGERSVKIAQLDLQMRREIDMARLNAQRDPALSPNDEEAQIKRKYQLLKDQTAFELRAAEDKVRLEKRLAEIQYPGITTNSAGFDPADLQKFGKIKSVDAANARFSDALSTLQKTQDAHLDTTEASREVLKTQQALADTLKVERQRSTEMDGQMKVQALQLSEQRMAASNAASILALETQITAAIEAKNGPLQQQLETMRDQLKTAQQLDAYLHPEKYETERRAGAAREQAVNRMNADEGLVGLSRGTSGQIQGGRDPLTGEERYHVTTDTGRSQIRMLPPKPPKPPSLIRNSVAGGPELLPDLPDIPNYPGTADLFTSPRNLGEAERMNGRTRSSFEMKVNRRLLSPEQMRAGLPHGLDIFRPGRNEMTNEKDRREAVGHVTQAAWRGVAEQNRPSQPRQEQSPVAAINQLVPQLTALVAGLNKVAAKIGTA